MIAAVWAIVPATTKLGFRLSLSLIDWVVIIFTLLLIHYLAFEPMLKALGWYFSFGPWRWNLTSNSATYLLLLGLLGYLYMKLRKTTLAPGKIDTFERLFDALLLTKRYDQLAALLNSHIKSVFHIAEQVTTRNWLTSMVLSGRSSQLPDTENFYARQICKAKNWLASRFFSEALPEDTANDILIRLLNSQSLTTYLAVNHPRQCLIILSIPRSLRSDFGDLFFQALISDESSIFYSELKNNINNSDGYRTPPGPTSRLLSFYLNDVRVAQKHAVYRSVGEAVCQKIDSDQALASSYNEPLGYYPEAGRYKCPVYLGLRFFKIMVHEANHQQLHDHLWLHYLPHFTDKILAKVRAVQPEDEWNNPPTPFHYLINEIISTTLHWIEDGKNIPENNAAPQIRLYIPLQASKAMARILSSVILSTQIHESFKISALESVQRSINQAAAHPALQSVGDELTDEILSARDLYSSAENYLSQLSQVYTRMDPELKYSSEAFKQKLADKIRSFENEA